MHKPIYAKSGLVEKLSETRKALTQCARVCVLELVPIGWLQAKTAIVVH